MQELVSAWAQREELDGLLERVQELVQPATGGEQLPGFSPIGEVIPGAQLHKCP